LVNPELIALALKAEGLEGNMKAVLLNYALHANHESLAALDMRRVSHETGLGVAVACTALDQCVEAGLLSVAWTTVGGRGQKINVIRVNLVALEKIARPPYEYGDGLFHGLIPLEDEEAQG
jgi:hypothetical protein